MSLGVSAGAMVTGMPSPESFKVANRPVGDPCHVVPPLGLVQRAESVSPASTGCHRPGPGPVRSCSDEIMRARRVLDLLADPLDPLSDPPDDPVAVGELEITAMSTRRHPDGHRPWSEPSYVDVPVVMGPRSTCCAVWNPSSKRSMDNCGAGDGTARASMVSANSLPDTVTEGARPGGTRRRAAPAAPPGSVRWASWRPGPCGSNLRPGSFRHWRSPPRRPWPNARRGRQRGWRTGSSPPVARRRSAPARLRRRTRCASCGWWRRPPSHSIRRSRGPRRSRRASSAERTRSSTPRCRAAIDVATRLEWLVRPSVAPLAKGSRRAARTPTPRATSPGARAASGSIRDPVPPPDTPAIDSSTKAATATATAVTSATMRHAVGRLVDPVPGPPMPSAAPLPDRAVPPARVSSR